MSLTATPARRATVRVAASAVTASARSTARVGNVDAPNGAAPTSCEFVVSSISASVLTLPPLAAVRASALRPTNTPAPTATRIPTPTRIRRTQRMRRKATSSMTAGSSLLGGAGEPPTAPHAVDEHRRRAGEREDDREDDEDRLQPDARVDDGALGRSEPAESHLLRARRAVGGGD